MKFLSSKKTVSGAATEASGLDILDTPATAARWLNIAPRTLLQNARAGKIPCVKINARVLRFHRGTVLASLQK